MALANGTGEICAPSAGQFRPTESQARAKTRLRSWKRNHGKWSKQATFSGNRYRQLVAEGRARPYALQGVLRRDLGEVVSARALDLLEHLLACERAFGGHAGGAILRHATSAELLRCSPRTAGDAMRELVEVGLVEQRPWFVKLASDEEPNGDRLSRTQHALVQYSGGRGKHKHREVTPRYVTTKRCREMVAAYAQKNQAGKFCQPGRAQRSLREHEKESRGRGRPGARFAAELRWARQDASAAAALVPVPTARVYMRHPDGRVDQGSPLHGGDGRLGKARDAIPRRRNTDADVFDSGVMAESWAAFEAHIAKLNSDGDQNT